MTFDITQIVEAVAALIGVVITVVVIPYIRSKTSGQQQQTINEWVKIAVLAAEQVMTGSGRGEEKKAYVVAFLQKHGMTLDMARLDALIEAAVYELNQGLV